MTLGERLKIYRTQKGLSQEKIAEMLHVSRQAVTKWESDQTTPSSDNLIALANLYDVSLDELIGKSEEKRASAEEEKKKHFSPKENPILRNNLIIIAIIAQAAFLNIAIQPLYTEGTPKKYADRAFILCGYGGDCPYRLLHEMVFFRIRSTYRCRPYLHLCDQSQIYESASCKKESIDLFDNCKFKISPRVILSGTPPRFRL